MSRVMRNQCSNCTCLPGLLSRNNRRVSLMAKRISRERSVLGLGSRSSSRKASVFSMDPALLCLPETKEVNTLQRLLALRLEMSKHDVAIYIVPSEDQHQLEYVAPADQRRAFISGFLGSAGVAIVTRDLACMNEEPQGSAALSTDSRYFAQATNELDFNWLLLKQGDKSQPSWQEWSAQQAVELAQDLGTKTIRVGVDPRLITFQQYKTLQSTIENHVAESKIAVNVEVVPIETNLVDSIWQQFEEPAPRAASSEIFPLDFKYTGQQLLEKLAKVRQESFGKANSEALVITALDEIAWLLNLRGQDIEYNPVFFAFMVLTKNDGEFLYISGNRLSPNIASNLKANNITVKSYDDFYSHLSSVTKDLKNVSIPKNANWLLASKVPSSKQQLSIVQSLKAIKNQTELDGAKNSQIKDGLALIKFFSWLDEQLSVKEEFVDEVGAADQLNEFRTELPEYRGPSFPTISALGSNGAIVHYGPVRGSCAVINPSKMYLNDSGAQFLDGTTDTTRTVHHGQPTLAESTHYTCVLKGHIALASARFPAGTTGNALDPLARQYLWRAGLDYGHGTGHGVGAYLNVHEGPIGISARREPNVPLEPGNLITNEPGYYEEGEYGIRLENMMYVKDSGYVYNGVRFLEFETITLVPFCKGLINTAMLDDREVTWLNRYHKRVWDEYNSKLDSTSYAYKWLKRETFPIKKCGPPQH